MAILIPMAVGPFVNSGFTGQSEPDPALNSTTGSFTSCLVHSRCKRYVDDLTLLARSDLVCIRRSAVPPKPGKPKTPLRRSEV
ncbi:hypothetical protein EVAR_4026_1 [Eumeta japonica]|uniref:Uncharacterized protein n=1 Tax=Eumeta variegata TaxID=151549 RepID=A0A4C1T4N9_EUMVA|nr:hypothetical protein EVAR_4026_1 [Eumeta japonica]